MAGVWIAALIALWIVVLAIGFLLVGVLRELGLLHLRLGREPGALIGYAGLDRGTEAPDFEAVDARTGASQSFLDLPPLPRMLVFLSPSCITCYQVAEHLGRVVRARPEFDYLVVCSGEPTACREFANQTVLEVRMLIDEHGVAEQRFEVMGTPFAYVFDKHNRVLIRGVVNDERQLNSLLDEEGTLEPTPPTPPADAAELERVRT